MYDTEYHRCMTTGASIDFEVIGFFPADHAAVAEGKLYVNGGIWDRLQFPSYPQVLPQLSLVMALRVPYRAYLQDHKFEMTLEDADAQPTDFRVEGGFRVGADPNLRTGDASVMQLAVPIAGVTLQKAGDYSFVLRLDGTEVSRYQVRAVQVLIPGGAIASPGPGAPEDPEA